MLAKAKRRRNQKVKNLLVQFEPYKPSYRTMTSGYGGNGWGNSLAPTYTTRPAQKWSPPSPSRRALTDEVASLRRHVSRLKDLLRDAEQVDDEVWIRDGRIFYQHRCNGVLLEQEISKGWRITSAGDITPSFSCRACSAHFHATVIVQLRRVGWSKPADWAPRYESVGSWQGHTPASSNTQMPLWKGVGF